MLACVIFPRFFCNDKKNIFSIKCLELENKKNTQTNERITAKKHNCVDLNMLYISSLLIGHFHFTFLRL